MPARRTLALLLVCLIVPTLASCSDDKKDSATAATTTTAAAAGGSATTDTPTTAVQLPFDEGVAKMNDNLDAAKGDVCALVGSLGSINVADPTTPDQAKEAVDVVAKYLDAIADAAPDQAAALHKAATDFKAEAQAANYDVSALSESKVMSSADVGTAMSKATAKCSAPAGG